MFQNAVTYQQIKFCELGKEEQSNVMFGQIEVAIRYATIQKDGLTMYQWVHEQTACAGMGHFPYGALLKDDGTKQILFKHMESVVEMDEVFAYCQQTEKDPSKREKIQMFGERMKRILWPLEEDRNFYLDYYGKKVKLYGSDEFEPSSQLKRSDFRTRLSRIQELSETDPDLKKLDEKKILMETAFDPGSQSFFEVDYALEKYFLKKEKEFEWFCRYMEERIQKQENHITEQMNVWGVWENIYEELIKQGSLLVSDRGKYLLSNPEGFRYLKAGE